MTRKTGWFMTSLTGIAGLLAAIIPPPPAGLRKAARSELREDERALRLRTEELDRFFDLSLDLLCIADTCGRFRRLNPAWEKALGTSREELLAGSLLDFIHRDDVDNTAWAISQLTEQKEVINFINRFRCQDGTYRWLEWRAVPSGGLFYAAARDVTDREQIETALWESAAEIMDLYNNAPCGYHSLDADGVFLRINDTELSWLGYSRDEVVGKKRFPDLLTPGSLQIFEESFPRFKQSGWAQNLEFEMIRKDGSAMPVLMSATVVSDAQGRYVMSRSTVFDVTDRKRAEETIRLNELRLESMVRIAQYRAHDVQALLDYALDEAITLTGSTIGYIYDYDEDLSEFRLSSWSKGGAREYAVTAARTVHPLETTGLWGEAVRQRRPIVVNDDRELHSLKRGGPDGQVQIHRLMTVPVLDGDRIVAVIGVANKDSDYDPSDVRQLVLLMDSVWRVVERKHADEVLRQSEQRLNLLIQQTPLAVIEWDTESRVARWNPAAERVFGYTAAEAIGRHGSFIAPDGGWPLPEGAGGDLQTNGGGARSILDHVTKDGRTILCEWHSTPLTTEDGKLIGVAALASDITELRKAEREMKETLEIKSQFISTVSHELRTPLTAIKESIEIVREETAGTLTAEADDFLDVARRNIDRLSRLIHNVLAFQRLEAGSIGLDRSPQDLNEIVREVAAAMSPLAAQKTLEVSLALEEKLPRVECDRDQITQVLTNLIGNAIKFSDRGRVLVATGASDNRFMATVTDTGCGISEEDLPRLFQKFRQLGPWDERAAGGSGLGLAISKEIVERHGGSIWVESEFGEGTAVRFVLPIGVAGG
jgi:PAS domain S-box-containing protein